MVSRFRAALFDLDGVIVDTAKYHYLAWKEVANELGILFTEKDNERLKGVSRVRSLEILLNIGRIVLSEEERQRVSDKKNKRYIEYISRMGTDEILPGAMECLLLLRKKGIKTALCSASKNTVTIVKQLKVGYLFNAIIDGNVVVNTKPDPEVFLRGAKALNEKPAACVVFEDAQAGIEAAKAAGMYVVGIGASASLKSADLVVRGLYEFDINLLF